MKAGMFGLGIDHKLQSRPHRNETHIVFEYRFASSLCLSQESTPLPHHFTTSIDYFAEQEEWTPVTSTGMTNLISVPTICGFTLPKKNGEKRNLPNKVLLELFQIGD